jgi:hypothetical protein
MESHKTTAFARFSVPCSKCTWLRVLWCFQFVRRKSQYRVLQCATVCYRALQCAGSVTLPHVKRQWQLTARSAARAYRLAVLRSAHTLRLFVCFVSASLQTAIISPTQAHCAVCDAQTVRLYSTVGRLISI